MQACKLLLTAWQASLFLLLPVKFAILYTVSNIFSIGRYASAPFQLQTRSINHICYAISAPDSLLSWRNVQPSGVVLALVGLLLLFMPSHYFFHLSLAARSTMFLMGPMKQLGKMFDKGRIVATCAYLASLGLTLWAALWVSPTPIVMPPSPLRFCKTDPSWPDMDCTLQSMVSSAQTIVGIQSQAQALKCSAPDMLSR